MRIGIIQGTGGQKTLTSLVDAIVQAEKDGFASCWLAQIFAHDALTAIALAGQRTSRMEIGTAVVPTYPRHPHSLAQQAATVNVAIGHRLGPGDGLERFLPVGYIKILDIGPFHLMGVAQNGHEIRSEHAMSADNED